jgi:hypothetical protein
MQHRFVVAGIVCLMIAGPACAQAMGDDQQQGVQKQHATAVDQSKTDSSTGGVPDTRSQYGAPIKNQNCAYPPNCDIYFGS